MTARLTRHPFLGLPSVALKGSLLRQIGAALLLGAVIIYGVEFSAAPVAHNAAHDVRHANGRPCH